MFVLRVLRGAFSDSFRFAIRIAIGIAIGICIGQFFQRLLGSGFPKLQQIGHGKLRRPWGDR